MSDLRVLFFLLSSKRVASSRVRGFWIAEELEQLGVKCSIVFGNDRISFFRCLIKLPFHDVLFLQKRCSRWDYYIARLALFMGKKTIFDIDDAYSRVKSSTTLFNVGRIMNNVSAVTVGCQNLLDFAKKYQTNSFLIPTCVKLKYYTPKGEKKVDDIPCLGWIGNGTHYFHDLVEILGEPLNRLASRHRIRFKLVGACGQKELYEEFSDIPGLEIDFIDNVDWSNHSEVVEAVSDFDIGLFPILDNDFNLYKCGFKALEYMALGIPVVASPIGANSYIVTDKVDGYHAGNEKDWVEALSNLVADKSLRKKMGRAGRDKVERAYGTRGAAKKLLRIIDKPVGNV